MLPTPLDDNLDGRPTGYMRASQHLPRLFIAFDIANRTRKAPTRPLQVSAAKLERVLALGAAY